MEGKAIVISHSILLKNKPLAFLRKSESVDFLFLGVKTAVRLSFEIQLERR